MLKDFWKIDRSQGESRFAQLLGIWILSCVVAFLIWHFDGGNPGESNLISANQYSSDSFDAELEKANFKGATIASR